MVSNALSNGIQVTTNPAETSGASRAGGVQPKGPGEAAGRAGGAGADEVQLSTLGAAIESLQPGSEAREARVRELQAAVESGAYKVNAQAVAGAVIEEASRD